MTFFRTTHKVKTHQVVTNRGQHCGGSSTDPNLNGQLRYPNNLDQSLNDTTADKVRKYRADYNMNPPNTVSFIPAIDSTSGRLHDEFVRL